MIQDGVEVFFAAVPVAETITFTPFGATEMLRTLPNGRERVDQDSKLQFAWVRVNANDTARGTVAPPPPPGPVSRICTTSYLLTSASNVVDEQGTPHDAHL